MSLFDKKGEDEYKRAGADEISIAIKSPDERMRDIEKKRPSSSKTTILYRNIKRNPDLLLLGLIVLVCTAVGYCVARIKFGLTVEEIRLGIYDFVEVLLALFGAVVAIVLKVYTKAGPLVQSLQSKGNKEEIDEYGRTITGNSR